MRECYVGRIQITKDAPDVSRWSVWFLSTHSGIDAIIRQSCWPVSLTHWLTSNAFKYVTQRGRSCFFFAQQIRWIFPSWRTHCYRCLINVYLNRWAIGRSPVTKLWCYDVIYDILVVSFSVFFCHYKGYADVTALVGYMTSWFTSVRCWSCGSWAFHFVSISVRHSGRTEHRWNANDVLLITLTNALLQWIKLQLCFPDNCWSGLIKLRSDSPALHFTLYICIQHMVTMHVVTVKYNVGAIVSINSCSIGG